MIYLDANATEPLRPEARDAALAAMEQGGNPSSVHLAGRAARKILESARERVAEFTSCKPGGCNFLRRGDGGGCLGRACAGRWPASAYRRHGA